MPVAADFLLGVVGGMGPLATADFLHKLILATPAHSDQEHVPAIVWNVPQIADRQRALAGTGPSPLPQLREIVLQLNRLGCTCIVMPCNTAHHWFEALRDASAVPLLHLVDAALDALDEVGVADALSAAGEGSRADGDPRIDTGLAPASRVGLIATRGTLQTGLYQAGLARRGLQVVLPTESEMDRLFTPGCYAVKRNALDEGGQLLELAAQALVARGAQRLVLACTEVPPALAHVQSALQQISVDPAQALARAVVARWLTACRAQAAGEGRDRDLSVG